MLKSLIKVQLQGLMFYLFNRMSKRNVNGKQRSGVGIYLLLGFLCLYFIFIFSMLFLSISTVASEAGIMWTYFAFYFIIALFFVVFGSVFLAKVTLFEAKDNTLLLSMPIPPKMILLSRMITLFILDFALSSLIAIPCFFIYIISSSATFVGAILFVVLSLLLALFGLALTALIAWLFSIITAKMRHKSIFTTITSFIMLIGIMALAFGMGTFEETIMSNPNFLSDVFSKFIPAVWFGKAIAEANMLYFFGYVVLFAGLFVFTYYLLSASFIRLTTMEKSIAKVAFTTKKIKSSTPIQALLKHDFGRLGSSSTYLLNSCFGMVFAVVFAVALIVMGIKGFNPFNSLFSELPVSTDATELIVPICIGISVYIFAMTIVTAPSISMEGKNFWIVKSMPITSNQFFLSKFLVQTCITAPCSILISIGIAVFAKPTGMLAVYAFLTPLLFSILVSLVGLMEGIRHANLVWLNEALCVKQSKAVMFTMLIILVYALLVGGLSIVFSILAGAVAGLTIFSVLTIIFIALCSLYLVKGGKQRYEKLN